MLGTGAGFALNPIYTAAKGAAVVGGRGIDALTGRRSGVRRFVQQNQGQGGVPVDPTAASLRQQRIDEDNQRKLAAAQQQKLKSSVVKMTRQCTRPSMTQMAVFAHVTPASMLDELGLNPQQAVQR